MLLLPVPGAVRLMPPWLVPTPVARTSPKCGVTPCRRSLPASRWLLPHWAMRQSYVARRRWLLSFYKACSPGAASIVIAAIW